MWFDIMREAVQVEIVHPMSAIAWHQMPKNKRRYSHLIGPHLLAGVAINACEHGLGNCVSSQLPWGGGGGGDKVTK